MILASLASALSAAALTLHSPAPFEQIASLDLQGDHEALIDSAPAPPRAIGDLASWSDGHDRHAVVHHDVDALGTHWVRGREYKASAGASGFAFIPFLGSDAPENYPLRLRLTELVRDGVAVALGKGATVTRSEDRLVLDRGAVRVRYDLAPEGAEQSFEIDHVPGAGDLVLSIGVETELAFKAHGNGFRFSNERGGVDYGAAAVLDSAGRRVDVPASWSASTIHLSVPASFLDQAQWPIVVDPLLTPFTVGLSTADLSRPDTSYNSRNNWFDVVFEERFSGADTDVFTWRVALDGTLSGGAYLDQTTADWSAPRVSVDNLSGKVLVVAVGSSAAVPGSTDIVSRLRIHDGTLDVPRVLRSAELSFSCIAPAVGTDGYSGGGGDTFLVAYNRIYAGSSDVRCFGFKGASSDPLSMDLELAAGAALYAGPPAVSSTSGTCCGWWSHRVAWSQTDVAMGASSVRAAIVSFDVTAASGPFTVAGPSTSTLYFGVDVSPPVSIPGSADPSALYYLVTYDDRPSNVTDAFVAVCSVLTVHNTYELQLSEHADRTPNQNDLQIATGTDNFMLGYEEDGELFMTIVEPINGELGVVERRRVAIGSNLVPGSLAGAGAIYSPSTPWGGLFVWAQSSGGSSGISGAFAEMPTNFGSAAGIQYCYGNPNSTGDRGFIQVSGNRQIGTSFELRVEALPPNTFGYYLVSKTPGRVPNAGGSQGTLCLGGSIGRFGIFQTDSTGFASQPLNTYQIATPLGPVAAIGTDVWHFQCWHRDSVGGAALSNFTNATKVRFR